jgi:hypothetical protein
MATRTSARLAALSPPPSVLAPTNVTFTSESRSGGVLSSMAWTQRQLDEYGVQVVKTAELSSLLPSDTKDEKGLL